MVAEGRHVAVCDVSLHGMAGMRPPQRVTWPAEGDGKCIVQHNVSVSQ